MEYGLKPLAFWAITLPLTYSVTMINPVGWWGLQFTQDLTDYKLITWLGSRIFSFTLNKNRSCVWFLAHLVQFADISKNTSDLLSEIGRHFALKWPQCTTFVLLFLSKEQLNSYFNARLGLIQRWVYLSLWYKVSIILSSTFTKRISKHPTIVSSIVSSLTLSNFNMDALTSSFSLLLNTFDLCFELSN